MADHSSPPSNYTPRQIFHLFDRGEMSREEFRAAMAYHVHDIIEEMEEAHQNPLAAWMEGLKNRRLANRLARTYGEHLVREIFVALSEVPGFAPARWLWNADRTQLPLHCFLRTRLEPIFRVQTIHSAPFELSINVEHGSAHRKYTVLETFYLTRDRYNRLFVSNRRIQRGK